ncbi:MAG: hypothetical protein ABL907_14005 [Hyphomicrobium sp.]
MLFLIVSANGGANADGIASLIRGLKNQSPEQFQLPEGEDFDTHQLERMPAIEKVGAEIAAFLRQAERLRREEDRPPNRR